MIQIDIDMPERCLECVCLKLDKESPFFDGWCALLRRMVNDWAVRSRRQEDCPLKEVKDDE